MLLASRPFFFLDIVGLNGCHVKKSVAGQENYFNVKCDGLKHTLHADVSSNDSVENDHELLVVVNKGVRLLIARTGGDFYDNRKTN